MIWVRCFYRSIMNSADTENAQRERAFIELTWCDASSSCRGKQQEAAL